MAEFGTCKYLQFVELVAANQISPTSEARPRLQHLLFEVFKRTLACGKALMDRAVATD